MPTNITDVARAMMARGVDEADLGYALELTMSSASARKQGHQVPLMRLLLDAGTHASRSGVLAAAAYREAEALRALLQCGHPVDAPVAAALGDDARLRELVTTAGAEDIQTAFALAVVNGHVEAARIALDAGADVDAYMPVHAHSTALHQAAADDDVAMIDLLLSRGARTDQRDTLWDGTPLDWAIHVNRPAARAALERAEPKRP